MAKNNTNIVFDSERLEQQQRLKRILIPVAVVAAVVIITVVLALVLRNRAGEVHTGGEDTPYPYKWQAEKGGTVILEIDRSAAPDCLWSAGDSGDAITVETEQPEDRAVTRFTLTPARAARQVITFTLHKAEDVSNKFYELTVLVEAAESGRSLRSELLSFSGKGFFGTIFGGEDTYYPYVITMDEDGDVEIAIMDFTPSPEPEEEEEEDLQDHFEDEVFEGWLCECENEEVLAFLGIAEEDYIVIAYLRPTGAAGTARVIMRHTGGTQLTLEIEADGGGSIQLLNYAMSIAGQEG